LKVTKLKQKKMKRVLLVLATVLLFASCDLNLDLKKRGFVKVSDCGMAEYFEECASGGTKSRLYIGHFIIYTDGETFIAVNSDDNDDRYIIEMGPYTRWSKKYCGSDEEEKRTEFQGRFLINGCEYYVRW
jgi:hypothetical protein